jgi:uncharacterized membrane protein
MSPRPTYSGKRLDRLVNISDAITAVAITLLAVPLIGLMAPQPDETFTSYLWSRAGSIIAFAFTFAIVFGQWRVHNRILSDLVAYDGVVFWINVAWLAGIAFLPWPSNLVGMAWESGDVLTTGAGGPIATFYWFSLAFVIAMATIMRTYVMRHPGLVDPQHWPTWQAARRTWSRRSLILLLGFIACGILWYFSALAGVACLVVVVILLAVSRGHNGSPHPA